MKKLIIALFGLAAVFIVSVTITDEAKNVTAGTEKYRPQLNIHSNESADI